MQQKMQNKVKQLKHGTFKLQLKMKKENIFK